MNDEYKIDDNRPISYFSTNSFCGYKINDLINSLKKQILKENNVDKAIFFTLELLSSGKIDKLYSLFLNIYCKNINTFNPTFPHLFFTRYLYYTKLKEYYKEILKAERNIDLLFRNDQGIRNHMCELTIILLKSSKKKEVLKIPTFKRVPDDINTLNFSDTYGLPGDDKEVLIIFNQFTHYTKNNEIKKALEWFTVALHVEKLKIKEKQSFKIAKRNISGVDEKWQTDFTFIFWQLILDLSKSRDIIVQRSVKSFFNIYKYNFTSKSRKIDLFTCSLSFVSEVFSVNVPLVQFMSSLIQPIMNVNIFFTEIKKHEVCIAKVEELKKKKKKLNPILVQKLTMQNEMDQIFLNKIQ